MSVETLVGDLKERFATKYSLWLQNHRERNEEHLSAPTLKNLQEGCRLETNSTLPGHVIYGFKYEIDSLKDFLLDPKVYNEFKSLVVVGEFGVGKTTLCKMIVNDDDVKSVYAPRVWVSMRSTESEEGLKGKRCVVKKILRGLGVEETVLDDITMEAKEDFKRKEEKGEKDRDSVEEEELAALLYALYLNLRWKKYLIVIDDVREEDNWNEKLDEKPEKDEEWWNHISDGFAKGSGGRVIYTTRDNALAKKLVAEEHEIHRLWPLSDSQCVWNIYKAALEENEKELPKNDKEYIEELMHKSCGLPLTVRQMAELLPVFLGDKLQQNSDILRTTQSLNNPTLEQTSTTQPLQTREDMIQEHF